MEDLREVSYALAHIDPVLPIVGNVVADEGTHAHRVAANYADSAGSGSGGLGGDGGAHEYAVVPVAALIYQGSGLGAAAAEEHSADGHAVRVVILGGEAGAVDSRAREAGVRMSALGAVRGIPGLALPVEGSLGRILIHALPPNGEVGLEHDVREDGVLLGAEHRVRVGLHIGAGSDAEEAVLGVAGPKSAVGARADPGDIVADGPALPALLAVNLGRDDHGQVGLSAGGGEGAGDVGHVALGILNAEDEHMLGHPALAAAENGGDAEREALLAEKDVSAVAGVDGPDGVVLRELNDVAVLLVELSLGVESLDEVGAVSESVEHLLAHAGHDRHGYDDVDGVGELDAVLCERGADDAHGIGDNVHGAALHGAVVDAAEL